MAIEQRAEDSGQITLSVMADIGGFVGHSAIHPALAIAANEKLAVAKSRGMLVDYHVSACGDDLQLIMTHRHGVDHEPVHRLAWRRLRSTPRWPRSVIWYGAGRIC